MKRSLLREQITETTLALVLVFALFGLSYGCTKAYQPHPGTANLVDSRAYDALLEAKGAIEQAKADFTAGKLPADSRDYINQAVAAYSIAHDAYLAYHDAALAGKDTPAMLAKLEGDLDGLTATIAAVEKKAGKTP